MICCFLRRDKADIVHHLYLSEFKKAYPEAKLLGVDGTPSRMEDKALEFDGGENLSSGSRDFFNFNNCIVWGKDAPNTKYGFEDDVRVIFNNCLSRIDWNAQVQHWCDTPDLHLSYS
jgi:hypothetical protein